MKDQLKAEISHSLEKLQGFKASMAERVESMTDKVKEVWSDAEKNLKVIDKKLESSLNALNEKSDEALLQAHLGAMEAHDAWAQISDSVSALAQHAGQKSKTELDLVALKAHLAKMEVKSFVAGPGKEFIKRFNQTRHLAEKEAVDAIRSLGTQMDKVAQNLRRDV